jgi:hypothetical protein
MHEPIASSAIPGIIARVAQCPLSGTAALPGAQVLAALPVRIDFNFTPQTADNSDGSVSLADSRAAPPEQEYRRN